VLEGFLDLGDDRHTVLRLPGARGVENRDDVLPPVAEHAARLCLPVELERDRHLPDRTVGADSEDRRRTVSQIRPARNVEPIRGASQVPQLDTVLRGQGDELGIAAGVHIASLMDHVNLDGNLLLADDPAPGVAFVEGVQLPSQAPGLGVTPT